MPATLPRSAPAMHAMAFLRRGGFAASQVQPVPEPAPGQVLVRLRAAGVGRWDLLERDGLLAPGGAPAPVLPLVAGSEGAGVVVAVGPGGSQLAPGMAVYGLVTHRAPKAGCFAEYTCFADDAAWPMPPHLAFDQAAVLPVDGAVAVQALYEVLRARRGDRLVVFGASGGVGHLALQLAVHLQLRTLAIVSGPDGMRLATRLGADRAVDGHRPGVADVVARFCAGRPALALFTAGGEAAAQTLAALPAGSRAAWPHGVALSLADDGAVTGGRFATGYGPALMQVLHRLCLQAPLVPHVSLRRPLSRLQSALEAIGQHHLGRIAVLCE